MSDEISLYEEVAAGVETILTEEFAPEEYVPQHDYLHTSVGHDRTRIGISPVREYPSGRNAAIWNIEVLVQFYGKYNLEIDNLQRVDPRKVSGYATRLARAVERFRFSVGGKVWFMNFINVAYLQDPTGNKSRFEATLVAYSDNPSIVETDD